ncbi:MAG: efflux RND transporter periplasmic adaptor subunit [Nitrospiraceae bacterium]|nr:efflux RND transporter periplasmic adaptor subunit [Nitrospirota bacterium]MDA8338603.1 efflux RND transporter periplasmic adaptor subunit [Nitrospiraceae bacterium]
MKKILIGAAVVIALGIIAFIAFRSKEEEPKFRTEKVTKGDIVQTVTATGTVNAVTTVLVGTQVSGTIKHIYVDFNSPVKKGQLIAQIDPATFEAQVEQAKANLLLASANLEKSEASLVDAQRTMNRNRELFSRNLIARSELDTSETNYETAKAQVSASKAQVSQAEAALKNAETNLRYTRILSPVDGIVISRNVDVGQTVAATFQTPTLFTIAQDLTKMQIDTNVDEADIGKIKAGQDVEFTVDAYPDITFKGRVSQVRIAPIIVQNVVTYDVVIRVDNPEIKLKPGMTANVSIIVAGKNNVLKIHNAALRFRPPETGKPSVFKGTGVWKLKNGKPRRIEVTTGISDGNYTEIVSGELKEGQEIIVESITKAKGGRASTPTFFR